MASPGSEIDPHELRCFTRLPLFWEGGEATAGIKRGRAKTGRAVRDGGWEGESWEGASERGEAIIGHGEPPHLNRMVGAGAPQLRMLLGSAVRASKAR